MRALVTNDDGVDSAGIHALARAAVRAGLETVVAAPSWDASGSSAAITAAQSEGRFVIEERRLDGTGVVGAWAVEAAPAFIVRTAFTGAFGPAPDVVLSGINHGPNTGRSILHSGTVGAALTGLTRGRRALAVSIGVGPTIHWETAAAVVAAALRWLLDADGPVALNVNVPNLPLGELRGFERARLAAIGAVQATVTETGKGYVKLEYDDVERDLEPGTDEALYGQGVACFTPLQSVCEAASVDTSALAGLEGLKGGR